MGAMMLIDQLRRMLYVTALLMMAATVLIYAWISEDNLRIREGLLPTSQARILLTNAMSNR
jgi:hypothetical protein